MRQEIAILVAVLAYAVLLGFWLWAGVSYMACVKALPATKDRCAALANILLNKIILAAIAPVRRAPFSAFSRVDIRGDLKRGMDGI
jgi:hypothetical protein